ncbi:MAG: glycoside hydrolase family 31 protein [Saprospiraceae bacterium]
MRHSSLVLCVFLLGCNLINRLGAQTNVGTYQSGYSRVDNTFNFPCQHADVQLEVCTATMVRIRTSWSRKFEEDEPWMVVKYQWPAVDIESYEESDRFMIKTSSAHMSLLEITIWKAPFSIEIRDSNGVLLCKEEMGAETNNGAVWCTKTMGRSEHFFGFGERMDFCDQRGKKLTLHVGRGQKRPHILGAYNTLETNYCPVPFFMSTAGYGIFLHNSYASEWDMGHSDQHSYRFGAVNGELDYYFIYGPGFPNILDQYTDLTGKAPLLPLFALGLHVGTYSGGTWGHEELTSADYVVNLVRKFREEGIPLDVLHLDSTWRLFGKNGGKGATTFEWRETFTNPKAMFDSLYNMHINMAGVHLRPRFDNGNKLNLLEQAQKLHYTYPEADGPGEFVNFFDDKAVDWWWNHGVMQVASQGVKFVKTDEGSAFGHLANESDKTGPSGPEAERLHNLFPLAYAKAPYEHFAKLNNMRGMNHTREGFAGIQRYPFIFAGDWPSEWQYFAPVIKAGLNIGLSGVGNWAHCMGGFEHNADPELYIRWCQFGLLSPIAHLFGMDHPGYKEPWNYGEEALRIFKKYAQFRYRLLPYLYSTMYENHQFGKPVMRALVFEYQRDENVYSIEDQYMLGQSLMICPVTTKGAQTRVVYLPEGEWYNYNTGELFSGRQYIQVLTPLDEIPIFVKAGTIIPLREPVQYVGEKPDDLITLQIFPGRSAKLFLYDDDGINIDYKLTFTKIGCMSGKDKLGIELSKITNNYPTPNRRYLLEVKALKTPTSISLNGIDLKPEKDWHYDGNQMLIKLTEPIYEEQFQWVLINF